MYHKSFDFTYTIIPVYEDDELIPREFIIDIFASDGYAKHLVVSNGVPGKTIDQLADAMRGHEHDVFASLEYLSENDDGIKDYRERILNRVRQ